MNFYLHPDLKKYFPSESAQFEQLMALSGKVFRHEKGRITQRVLLGEQAYFIKQHHGVGWREIIKNIINMRMPVLSAQHEWRAIEKLNVLGVCAPTIVGYGKRGCNPANIQSFILMKEIHPAVSLEDVTRHWKTQPPALKLKRQLIRKVALIAKKLHENGVNHRDFYICHFLLETNKLESPLYLIDLHRAELRRKTPERWLIKDLAGLYFSSKDIGLTRNDYFYFIKTYRNKSLRDIVTNEYNFWQKVKTRGDKLYRDHGK